MQEKKNAIPVLDQFISRVRETMDGMISPVYIKDSGLRYAWLNRAYAGMIPLSGMEHAIGKTEGDFFPSPVAGELAAGEKGVLEKGAPVRETFQDISCPDGVSRSFVRTLDPIVIDGSPVGLLGILAEIPSQKVQERNLLHSANMETLGQMAGGLAHDFNNILTVINGYSEMMFRSMDRNHPFYGKMLQICQAGAQASWLTQKILEFSSKSRPEPKEIDVDQEMTGQETILRHVIEENIKLTVQKSAGVKKILIDPTQFAKVLLSLVINAKDAMPADGEITITTGALDVDERLAVRYDNIRPGRYLILCVSDTGSGMSEEVKQHVFDPFFTTRDSGKGVGLWIASSIVKDCQGTIQVESAEGKGTTFRILLPFSGQEQALPEEAPQDAAPSSEATGKTILVVEDDDTVRELVVEILEHRGHHVLTARNGGDALQLARKYEGTIDLLITDMVMRRIDGIMLSKKIRTILPGIRIMLMSGYGQDVIRREELKDIAFLQKPFLPRDLTGKVDAIFSGPA